MVVDIPVTDLISYLPHRSPMIWVNRVSQVGKDYKGLAGHCIVDIDTTALYMKDSNTIQNSAAIEFTAQGFGYLKAAYQVLHKFSDPPSKTYLTGVRSCHSKLSSVDVKTTKHLEIRLSVLRELLPITYVKGEIMDPVQKEILATTEIQVYVD